jgi:hypothetical protein
MGYAVSSARRAVKKLSIGTVIDAYAADPLTMSKLVTDVVIEGISLARPPSAMVGLVDPEAPERIGKNIFFAVKPGTFADYDIPKLAEHFHGCHRVQWNEFRDFMILQFSLPLYGRYDHKAGLYSNAFGFSWLTGDKGDLADYIFYDQDKNFLVQAEKFGLTDSKAVAGMREKMAQACDPVHVEAMIALLDEGRYVLRYNQTNDVMQIAERNDVLDGQRFKPDYLQARWETIAMDSLSHAIRAARTDTGLDKHEFTLKLPHPACPAL